MGIAALLLQMPVDLELAGRVAQRAVLDRIGCQLMQGEGYGLSRVWRELNRRTGDLCYSTRPVRVQFCPDDLLEIYRALIRASQYALHPRQRAEPAFKLPRKI